MANSTPPPSQSEGKPSSVLKGQRPLLPESDLPELLSDVRNSPEVHRRNFQDAQREHQRVLQAALHVYELHQLAEATRQIEEEEQRRKKLVAEEERRIETERQAKIKQLEDEARLAAQKAVPIPKPAIAVPRMPPPPSQSRLEPPTLPVAQPPQAFTAATAATTAAATAASTAASTTASVANNNNKVPAPLQSKQPLQPATSVSAFPPPPVTNGASAAPAPNTLAKAAQPAPALTPQPPTVDRHMQIHQNLKGLRKFVAEQAKTNVPLKKRMGDMRRDIRKSLGQLTSGGLKENRIPLARLVTVLQAGLTEVPSELVDPNEFLLEPRNSAVEGASHNEPKLPSLFLYLLNIVAKAAISQFINESGAQTRTAEAIGQAVVKVYSESDFLWRGQSMIDMLIAKYRIACPVLFGFRGNDRTDQGRRAIGWKKENGQWIGEQYHIDRMTGLGAGFAALTLRDFSRAKRLNPWPPSVYWTALSRIVNTPPELMSETQCYVLKAMIADNEARFMAFYGNAAVAALRCALVDYPARIPKPTSGTETLKVLAKSLAMKTGLDLTSM